MDSAGRKDHRPKRPASVQQRTVISNGIFIEGQITGPGKLSLF
jgi:hypothetical protein